MNQLLSILNLVKIIGLMILIYPATMIFWGIIAFIINGIQKINDWIIDSRFKYLKKSYRIIRGFIIAIFIISSLILIIGININSCVRLSSEDSSDIEREELYKPD